MIFFNHWNGKDGHLDGGFRPAFPVSAFTKNLSASSPGIHNNAKWNSVMLWSSQLVNGLWPVGTIHMWVEEIFRIFSFSVIFFYYVCCEFNPIL